MNFRTIYYIGTALLFLGLAVLFIPEFTPHDHSINAVEHTHAGNVFVSTLIGGPVAIMGFLIMDFAERRQKRKKQR